jgi:hypothetical protein
MSLNHLNWHVIEQRHGAADAVRCAVDDHVLAQDIAMRLRKAHPHVGYDVRQAPKVKKRDMAPGEWVRRRKG